MRGAAQNGGDSLNLTFGSSITFTTDFQHAVDISGNNNTLTSEGNISTSALFSNAIEINGDDNVSTLAGTISTSGDTSFAYYSRGDNNNIVLNGTIETSDFMGIGLYLRGNSLDATVAGNITTSGNNAYGIRLTRVIVASENSILNISGSIVTTGSQAHGAAIEAANSTVILSGSVSTSGVNSDALRISYGDNLVSISGNLTATGSGSNALSIRSSAGTDNTVTFQGAARIIGNISTVESGNTLRFDVGSAQSYVFATTGSWTLEDLDGRSVVAGSAMAAGIGNAETADELMFDRSMSLDSSLGRLERQSSFGELQALFDAYGFSQSRDEDGTTSAYKQDSRGMTIGLPLELLGEQAIAFVNYHDSEIDISSGTHDIDAQSVRFGLSAPKMWSGENYDIGLYAVAGRNSYDGTRDVLVNQNTTTGITTINASWDSTELEIGADVTSNMALASKLTLDSSLGLAAQVERIGSYAEENYFAWDVRTIVQAHAKAEVTLGYQATDTTRIYGTAGAWRRDVRSGETAHYTINNTAVSYNGGVYDDTISSLRIGLGHRLGNGAVISAEASAIDGGTSDRSYGASLAVAARF